MMTYASLLSSAASSVSLHWNISDISLAKKNKSLLHDVYGSASRGKLHAILGPSGSGKTTLLNSLAGELSSSKVVADSSNTISFHGRGQTPTYPIYIQQDDILFAQLTTYETLETSFLLSNGNDENSVTRTTQSLISKIINDLGLKKVQDSPVGDAKTRGLSGGEKKRLCIGNEITDSFNGGLKEAFIFADEPTSGLDCFQAEKVIELLQSLAKQGNTVVLSIHQPRTAIYSMFDEITLLSEGMLIYSGAVADMDAYFASIGYQRPSKSPPSEYYVDLVSVDYSTAEAELTCRNRIKALSAAYKRSKAAEQYRSRTREVERLNNRSALKSVVRRDASREGGFRSPHFISGLARTCIRSLEKFVILNRRAWRQVTRDKPLNIARLASSLFSSLLFGAIYYKLGSSVKTIPDRSVCCK